MYSGRTTSSMRWVERGQSKMIIFHTFATAIIRISLSKIGLIQKLEYKFE